MNKPQQFRIYDEKYRYWDNTPLVIYPNTPIVKQGRVIQWYSGLNDKNGVPIYEGDILTSDLVGDNLQTVIFKNGMFTLDYLTPGCYTLHDEINQMVGHRVVGNIFDTPELFKQS